MMAPDPTPISNTRLGIAAESSKKGSTASTRHSVSGRGINTAGDTWRSNVRQGVIAYKIAAHSADVALGIPAARDRDDVGLPQG